MSDQEEEAAFDAALTRIRLAASNVPEYELVGFVKGMIRECPEIRSQERREELFQLVALVGTAARASAPSPQPSIEVSQNVNQTASPQQHVSQNLNAGTTNAGTAKESSKGAIIVAIIGAIALIITALIARQNLTNGSAPSGKTTRDSATAKMADSLMAPGATRSSTNRR